MGRRLGLILLSVGTMVFASVWAAVYLGFSMAMDERSTRVKPRHLTNTSYIDIGDTLPTYLVETPGSDIVSPFYSVMGRNGGVLVFASPSCGSCLGLFEYWRRKVLPRLRPDIPVLLVYDLQEWDERLAPEAMLLDPRVRVLLMHRKKYMTVDGIQATPTILGVTAGGIVSFVCSGFDRRVDAKFLSEYAARIEGGDVPKS
jgi:hypothetical protein